MFKRVVFDLETNGLLPVVHTIHSLVIRDLDTNEVVSCADQPGYVPISEGLRILSTVDEIWNHNLIGYDIPVLKKLHPEWATTAILHDTLILARMRWAHIKDTDHALVKSGRLPGKLVGRHSLEAWGYRMGSLKGDYGKQLDAWDKWSPEMQTYCERDTDVTAALVQTILKAGVSPLSAEIESDLRVFLDKMEENGWPFNEEGAVALMADLAQKREMLGQRLRETFAPWQVSRGMWTPKVNSAKNGYVKGVPIERFKTVEFNPNSRAHICNRLKTLYGWEPTEFTDSGAPSLDDETIAALPYPEAPLLAEFLLVSKRLGQISEGKEAWLNYSRLHPLTGVKHIHGYVNAGGTVTHRASHSKPNIGQVPKVGKPYGKECRSLFIVPRGWKMMGADASGLELRCLAHYMARFDNGDYGLVILEGDIHTTNQTAAGLTSRDLAKTFIYAFLYGAGDVKLGSIVDPGASEERQRKLGAALRKQFLKNTPAMKLLVESVQAASKKRGWLQLPDKRKVYVRSQHAALNSLLQGAGAIICKAWIVEFDRQMTAALGPQGWEGKWAALGWIHDEIQIAVRPEIAAEACRIAVASIRSITQLFTWRVPLDGEAKLGLTWADTH